MDFHSLGSPSIASKTAFLSRTSKVSSLLLPPIVLASASSFSFLLPQRISRVPSWAKLFAVAHPIPLVAPVINAILFFLFIV